MPVPPDHVSFEPYRPDGGALAGVRGYYDVMRQRRSVRMFSDRPVPREVIEWAVRAAGTAPSGAHKQPWRFVAVADAGLKRAIREGAEEEEREFYTRRAGEEWLRDLEPFGTDADKSFLETAPWLITVFKLVKSDADAEGVQGQVYYVNESVGIAVGMLLSALHHAGLATLTHTPSPMKFLGPILARPAHERPYLLIPVGYPSDDCVVPRLERKALDEILVVRA